ncbi:hypothetical protein HNV10_13215 [Winogradskyella litoriviva]|uniref:Aldose 1-epimerase n=1 Tax=Winogradskyella litoriviva TaxID=1220182 RepID=A0ABX2E7A5_9FLAO|nr:hypothetical protein [Winogradskyella litoriviva]NRD24212.1 hypothetical protein [Winogradskyella litoriviva]
MPHILKNNTIEIHIDLPQEGYNGSRFDYSGKITTLKFKNILLSAIENPKSANANSLGQGFYNEFGIDTALGFKDAKIGGWFHKIGVGLLKKTDDTYNFLHKHEIKPAKFTVKTHNNKITIHCKPEPMHGYAYLLSKEIELQNDGFTISYRLENTGNKPIITDEYVHNFMAINNDTISDNYELNFPFNLKPELFEETVNPEDKVNIGKDYLKFKDLIEEEFFFSNLSGSEYEKAGWELSNHKSDIKISETGDFKTNKVNVWGLPHVISPELFIAININPGRLKQWSRHYKIVDTTF